MIYLFNSGKRDRYRINVLNTLFLPSGATNQYRYAAWGDRVNVAGPVRDTLLQAAAGTPVAIVFIDRFSGEYRYYPLRLGKLVNARRGENRAYVVVQLENFIWPNAPETFSDRFFRQFAGDGVPRLRDNDPQRFDDGNYILMGNSAFDDEGQFVTGDAAWDAAVRRLSTVPAFTDTEQEHVLFARAALRNQKGDSGLETNVLDGTARFKAQRAVPLQLHLSYRFPAQDLALPGRATIVLRPSDNLKAVGSTNLRVDNIADRFAVTLVPRRFTEDDHATLDFDYPAGGGSTQGVLAPDAALQFTVQDSKGFWVKIVLTAALFIIGGVLLGINLPENTPINVKNVVRHISLLRLFGVGLQTIALLLIARWVGKKIW
jgi:hypothetical protein